MDSCRSEEGITVGLVDAIIGIIRVLAPRNLSPKGVQEALADLFQDPDLQTIRDAQAEGGEPVCRDYSPTTPPTPPVTPTETATGT